MITTKLKSVALTTEEKKALQKLCKEHPTQERAAYYLGISRTTLLRILSEGSGSQDNIEKVRAKLAN